MKPFNKYSRTAGAAVEKPVPTNIVISACISEWISLSAPERAALGSSAIEAVRSRYGLDNGLDRMMALYSEAVAKGSNSTQHQSSGV